MQQRVLLEIRTRTLQIAVFNSRSRPSKHATASILHHNAQQLVHLLPSVPPKKPLVSQHLDGNRSKELGIFVENFSLQRLIPQGQHLM